MLKIDEARKSKEDTHRFLGKNHDAIIYNIEKGLASLKVFAFFPDKVSEFVMTGSRDGKSFSSLPVERENYSSGAGEYDYDKSVIFTLNTIPKGITYIKIQYTSHAEISRVELKYGD